MDWPTFLKKIGPYPDYLTSSQIYDLIPKPKPYVQVQIHRWVRAGKLIPLQRGQFALADIYNRKGPTALGVANQMVKPSYLTGHWVLCNYVLLPHDHRAFTSVTPHPSRKIVNHFGTFTYSQIKPELFIGFSWTRLWFEPIYVADPEKALLDYWYLEKGEWDIERLGSEGFRLAHRIEARKLEDYARAFPMRVQHAAAAYLSLPRLPEPHFDGRVMVGFQ